MVTVQQARNAQRAQILTHREKMREKREIRAQLKTKIENITKAREAKENYHKKGPEFLNQENVYGQRRQILKNKESLLQAGNNVKTILKNAAEKEHLTHTRQAAAQNARNSKKEKQTGILQPKNFGMNRGGGVAELRQKFNDSLKIQLKKEIDLGKARAKKNAKVPMGTRTKGTSWVHLVGYDSRWKIFYAKLGDTNYKSKIKDYYWIGVPRYIYSEAYYSRGHAKSLDQKKGPRSWGTWIQNGKFTRYWPKKRPSSGGTMVNDGILAFLAGCQRV